jgi:hypothetical protein
MVAIPTGTCILHSIESTKALTMTIDQRIQALQEAEQAFRNAWSLMDAAIGYDASSEIGETRTVQDIIQILASPEFIGVEESV